MERILFVAVGMLLESYKVVRISCVFATVDVKVSKIVLTPVKVLNSMVVRVEMEEIVAAAAMAPLIMPRSTGKLSMILNIL